MHDLRQRYTVDKVYVLGFSQGAIVALLAGVYNPDLVDGVVMFGLPGFDLSWFEDDVRKKGQEVRILFVHGIQDDRAPISVSEQARDAMKALGYDVTYHTFTGGHSVPRPELDFAAAWIRKR